MLPRCRPRSEQFERWAAAAPVEMSRSMLEEGIEALGEDERERIATWFCETYPAVWAQLVDDVGAEENTFGLLLLGAVVAGLEERRRPVDHDALAELEHAAWARRDPVLALAFVLEPGDIWSVIERGRAVDELVEVDLGLVERTFERVADRLATSWHDERLQVLIERLRAALPDPVHPAASAALEDACDAVARDKRARRRLCALLLLESLPSLVDATSLAA